MVLEKFIPRKPEKEVISMRIATEVLEQIDAEADACDISRNEFINQCIAFALRHMDNTKAE